MLTTREIQSALVAAGHELVIDGDRGEKTLDAVEAFQAASGLDPDRIVGPETEKALRPYLKISDTTIIPAPMPSVLKVAPWLSTMRAITGQREIPGAKSNPLILAWNRETIAKFPQTKPYISWYANDDTPWCGLCVGYTLAHNGFRPPNKLLGAINYANEWPDGIRLREPTPGAIGVFTRAGGGHVSLYESEDDNYFHIRGGNQSDMVNVSKHKKDDGSFVGWFWPKSYPVNPTGSVYADFAGAVARSYG